VRFEKGNRFGLVQIVGVNSKLFRHTCKNSQSGEKILHSAVQQCTNPFEFMNIKGIRKVLVPLCYGGRESYQITPSAYVLVNTSGSLCIRDGVKKWRLPEPWTSA
jgi:hypothetical protein